MFIILVNIDLKLIFLNSTMDYYSWVWIIQNGITHVQINKFLRLSKFLCEINMIFCWYIFVRNVILWSYATCSL
jgi:hypothetical protein